MATTRGTLCDRVVVASGNDKVSGRSLPRVFRQFCGNAGSSGGDFNVNLTLTEVVVAIRGNAIGTRGGIPGNTGFVVHFCGKAI